MKKLLMISCIALFGANVKAENRVLVIEGQYQNKNLYVSNAVSSSGIGFCAYEVRVNGKVTTDELNSSAFEIDLSLLQIRQGDNVTIQIFHKEGCVPKVLNSSVLKPQPTFETKSITLSETGLLKWTTSNETGSLPYEIEQFKWNKWVKVGEVQGVGTASENSYEFQVTLVSGNNKFRVIQKGNLGKIQKSNTVEINSSLTKPDFDVDNKKDMVAFNRETSYEIYDQYGQVRKRGYGNNIDMANLPDGEYYLSYDNYVETIKKK